MNGRGKPKFEKLYDTRRFQQGLSDYLCRKPKKRGRVNRVLEALLNDTGRLNRKPINNPKVRLFHSRVSKGDRLIDSPRKQAARETVLLNIGDHSVNKWAEKYDGDPESEIEGSVPYTQAPAATTEPVVGPAVVPPSSYGSPWIQADSREGTYGELLSDRDLHHYRVPDARTEEIRNTPREVELTELGIEEDTADAIESQYYLRARLSPAPPIPHVEPPAALTINEQTVPLVTEIPYEKLWATLTDEQLRLVKRPERGLMIVKGAAGSGKTIVGVRRIEHILAGQLFGRRVLYLCYNKVLQGIVDQQLTEILGDLRRASRVEVTTAYRWMLGIAERMMHSRLLGPESRSEEGKAVEKGVAEEETACASEARNSEVLTYSGIVRANRADGGKLKELILQTLSGLDRPRRNDLPGKFLLEEFRDVIYGRGILSESDYLDPGGTPRRDIRAPLGWSVPFRPEDRGYVWGVFEKFDALCRERNVIMWESIPWRLLKILPERPRDKREYDYIVIDEAQDLTPAMFKVVLRLQGESHDGIMVLGDAAQRLYRPAFRWVDTGLPPTGGHVSVLRRCQRSTRQIVAVAQSVAEGMEKGLGEDLVYPDAADRDGPLPLLISAEDQGMELQYLCEEIYRLLMDEYVPAASIAVLAGTRTLLEKVRSNLGEYGVPTEIYHGALETRQGINLRNQSVKLLTPFGAKGIEFPHVVLVGAGDYGSVMGGEERQMLLYACVTRATDNLVISGVGLARSSVFRRLIELGLVRTRSS